MVEKFAWLLLSLSAVACSTPDFKFSSPDVEHVQACRDGQLSEGEADVDCGVSCSAPCASGSACIADADCASSFCSALVCTDQTCSDKLKNQDESDLDCGGKTGCPRCSVGHACQSSDDCAGGACEAGMCRQPSCDDRLLNEFESDIDCGGSCPPCDNGKACRSSADCALALCTSGSCRPQSCSDGIVNQAETDVDCGGESGCQRCSTDQHCALDADCNHARCASGTCQPTSCLDQVRNGSETDVDCGGACAPCGDLAGCTVAKDCQSLVCSDQTLQCERASCSDGVKNGSESSVDCGASCAGKKCALTKACGQAGDCASNSCYYGRCAPKSPTNQAIPTTGWLASASFTESDATLPRFAIDGSPSTYWTTGKVQKPGMWFGVDMIDYQVFTSIEMTSTSMTSDYGKTVRVSVSDDGITYTQLQTGIAGEPSLKVTFTEPKFGRYLKIEVLEDTGYFWWRIDELRVLQ